VQGHVVNRKRVRRLMRLMGLVAIYQRPNTSKAAAAHKVSPRPAIFQSADYASKFCSSAIDNAIGLTRWGMSRWMTVHLILRTAPLLRRAAAFAASNVSAVPLAIRSLGLLPVLALRLTSHVITGRRFGSFFVRAWHYTNSSLPLRRSGICSLGRAGSSTPHGTATRTQCPPYYKSLCGSRRRAFRPDPPDLHGESRSPFSAASEGLTPDLAIGGISI
jgi:hypothetical protein